MSMDKWEAWCTDETQWRQLMRLIQAVHPCIPKKYRRHLRALFRHFPEASATYRIETTTASLGLLWHCDPEEAVRDLHRMTVRSHGTMTYSLGGEPVLSWQRNPDPFHGGHDERTHQWITHSLTVRHCFSFKTLCSGGCRGIARCSRPCGPSSTPSRPCGKRSGR